MTLMLHAGAEPVEYKDLRQLPVPAATETHVPMPHNEFVDMLKYSLGYWGHSITSEDYGVTPDGSNFFGVLSLQSDYGDWTDCVGLRNSHSKRFPLTVCLGSRVFVCDNLAMIGEYTIKRKHTKRAKYELPSLIAEIVEPLREKRTIQAQTFEMYQATALNARQVDHAIMQLFRRGIINVTRIAEVLDAYEKPPHNWGKETAYRLFNATTFALTGRIMETPAITAKLHDLMDDLCEEAFWDKARAPIQDLLLLPAP